MAKPLISVIMGIYNCEKELPQAIESIINQSVEDWELIMCDDGSTDGTFKVAHSYYERMPGKIVLLQNNSNQGLNYTLNHCLEHSKGIFIARMDGDDVCPPNRFEKELEVLENESEISFVSSDMAFFDETGEWGRISHPEYPEANDFVHGSPFCHAPCMVRREAFKKVGGYSEGRFFLRVEDYHLWIKMYSEGFKGKNIHEVLYNMRDDRNAYSRRKFKYRINEAYVRVLAVEKLKLPIWKLIFALRPILVGLLPTKMYDVLHKWNLRKG